MPLAKPAIGISAAAGCVVSLPGLTQIPGKPKTSIQM